MEPWDPERRDSLSPENADARASGDTPPDAPPPGTNPPLDAWTTQDLPTTYYAPGLDLTPRRRAYPATSGRWGRIWGVGVIVVLLVALAGGGGYFLAHRQPPARTIAVAACATNSPCGVVNAYLTAYTGEHFSAMYALTSNASRVRFSDPKILHPNYQNAQDYIVNRTVNILNAAGVSAISATAGQPTHVTATTAQVPARIVMTTARLGTISQDIALPLVNEQGQWRINWSPGLIFAQLDDPAADPYYQRVVHLVPQTGLRGNIYDRDGNLLAGNGPNGQRIYPYGADLEAVTGYVSVVTPQDLRNDSDHYYTQGDMVGHAGLEQWGEQYLRPVKGGVLQIVNVNADGSYGTPAYTIASRAAANGADIHTTIALADQQQAMASLRAQSVSSGSAAFVVDPTTGAVLVMASNPSCDPNQIAAGNTSCFAGPNHPQINYALSSPQPIGSVFKLVTLSAALTHGITPTQEFTCTGTYQVPGENHLRYDDSPHGHGILTAPDALIPSCDVVYWTLGVTLGNQDPNILPTMARAFGYGTPTGIIGVPAGVEAAGIVPDPQWIQQHVNARWSPSDSANLAIGQGFFEATAAQVAMATAAIADNGVRMQPRLVSSVVDSSGQLISSFPPTQIGTLPVSQSILQMIQASMLGVTSNPNGTAYDTFGTFKLHIGGKSGTAQSGQPLPQSWFTAFAPASPLSGPAVQPQLAMAALVEYSGTGDLFAARVCRAVLAEHFHVTG